MESVYLDNGATTRPDPQVVEAMLPWLSGQFGNPSSLHSRGLAAHRIVKASRKKLATIFDVLPDNIIFTSGGTEADALGVMGGARARHGKEIIISSIEHPAVSQAAKWLVDNEGYQLKILPVDTAGFVDAQLLESWTSEETCCVSIMHANNEIGVVQPIAQLAKAVHQKNPKCHFHVDTVQSFTKLWVEIPQLGVDSVAISSHKFHGPQGVGCLAVRTGAPLKPLYTGGGQEGGLRPGTENVAGIVGMTKAAEIACETLNTDAALMSQLRDKLIQGALEIEGITLNGHATERLCNNVNISIHKVNAEHLLHSFEEQGVLCSTGSACHSKDKGPSGVLLAIGAPYEEHGNLRLTLCRNTSEAEVTRAIEVMHQVVPALRKLW